MPLERRQPPAREDGGFDHDPSASSQQAEVSSDDSLGGLESVDARQTPPPTSASPRRAWLSRAVLLVGIPLALLPLANVWPREQTLQVYLPPEHVTPAEVEISLQDTDGEAMSASRQQVVDVRQPVMAKFNLLSGEYHVVVTVSDASGRQVHHRDLALAGEPTKIRLGRPGEESSY